MAAAFCMCSYKWLRHVKTLNVNCSCRAWRALRYINVTKKRTELPESLLLTLCTYNEASVLKWTISCMLCLCNASMTLQATPHSTNAEKYNHGTVNTITPSDSLTGFTYEAYNPLCQAHTVRCKRITVDWFSGSWVSGSETASHSGVGTVAAVYLEVVGPYWGPVISEGVQILQH